MRHRGNRRGSVIIVAFVSLILLTMATASLTRTVLMQRDIVRAGTLKDQAEWLFQSALTRAEAKLRQDNAYSGEVWNVTDADLGTDNSAVVEIKVTRDPEKDKRRRVDLHVEFTQYDQVRLRLTRDGVVNLP